jgi:DNA polymerase-3 subunit delta'
MMNQVSANAFLKTLEEPAKDSVIVLVTDKPGLLLSTISSRCRLVKFHPLPRRQLEEKLSQEHGVASSALGALASLSDGRLGLAVRLKDSDYLGQKNRIIDVFTSGADPELEEMLASNRESLRWSLQVMVSWFRDLYICKSASRAGYINSDRSQQIERSAAAISFEALDKSISILTESLRYNDHTINCKLLLAHLKLSLRQPAY